MAAEVSSIARMLRGEAVKRGVAGPKSEMVTMDLLGGCGGDSAVGSGGDDEVVDLEVKVPVGWERRLDLLVSYPLFSLVLFVSSSLFFRSHGGSFIREHVSLACLVLNSFACVWFNPVVMKFGEA
jgi:hypothetical protein